MKLYLVRLNDKAPPQMRKNGFYTVNGYQVWSTFDEKYAKAAPEVLPTAFEPELVEVYVPEK
jgi:hypothetical protein